MEMLEMKYTVAVVKNISIGPITKRYRWGKNQWTEGTLIEAT